MCDFKEVYIDFEKLGNTNREREFMSEITNISNELYHNLILLSGIRESEGLLSRKEAIICGLLLRAAKLFNSFMNLVVNHDSVGATFLYRGITDCIIDMEIPQESVGGVYNIGDSDGSSRTNRGLVGLYDWKWYEILGL